MLAEDATREHYDGERGVGQGLDPFWGWSALGYLMLLKFEHNYDPTDTSNESIRPLAQADLGIQFSQ